MWWATATSRRWSPSASNACDEFNYIEDLQSPASAESASAAKGEAKTDAAGGKADTQAQLEELDSLLKIAEEKYADDTGFVNISAAGSYIKRVKSDFKIRPLGYSKLPEYLKDHPERKHGADSLVSSVFFKTQYQ